MGCVVGDGEVSDLEGNDIVFVYDNEFVTKKLLEESETQLKEEERSSSGPPNVTQKDINDMVLSGHNVVEVVNQNIYQGLQQNLNLQIGKERSNGIKVKKRDGRIESLDLDKMDLMVQESHVRDWLEFHPRLR